MERVIITIDGGTTNTRCVMWNRKGQVIAQDKFQAGARDGAVSGDNSGLKSLLKRSLEQILEMTGITWENVGDVLASGMITSAAGLYELPHLTAPAGIKELAAGVRAVRFPEICPKLIRLIPGVKNDVKDVTLQSIRKVDIMRGEETESIALTEHHFDGSPLLLILPGSHNKYVFVNTYGQIECGMTSMSGEMLSAFTKHTILSSSVNGSFVEERKLDMEWMFRGYKNSKEMGAGRAAFFTRTLDLFCEAAPEKLQSYLLGTILADDMKAMKSWKILSGKKSFKAVLGGKGTMAYALGHIIRKEYPYIEVVRDADEYLAGRGAYLIHQALNQNKGLSRAVP